MHTRRKSILKEALVTFAGTDDIIQHIVSTTEKKANTYKSRQGLNIENENIDHQGYYEEKVELNHSQFLCAEDGEILGSEVYGFKTPKKLSLLLHSSKSTPSKAITPGKKSGSPSSKPATPKSILKRNRSIIKANKVQFDASNPGEELKREIHKNIRLLRNTPAKLMQRNQPDDDDDEDDDASTSSDGDDTNDSNEDYDSSKENKLNNKVSQSNNNNTGVKNYNTPSSENRSNTKGLASSESNSKGFADNNTTVQVTTEKNKESDRKVTRTPSSASKSSRKLSLNENDQQINSNTPGSKSNRKKLSKNEASFISLKTDLEEDDNDSEPTEALESYFNSQKSSNKISTSDRTLARLGRPQMEPDQISQVLNTVEFQYEEEREGLRQYFRNQFKKWMFYMSQGFNILLHGFGSKLKLIEEFRTSEISNFTHIVVNGFFPSITMKGILSSLAEVLSFNMTGVPFSEIVDELYVFLARQDYPDIFVIIHNIDGSCLRQEKSQAILSQLAKIKNFHLIASIDHINAPLLWDQSKLNSLNFLWFDCTTFESYIDETSYENSIMVRRSGSLAISSLKHILQSLTPNARQIFYMLACYHMENLNSPGFQGFAFPDLYVKCRENFLVNSELTLKTQLVEFKDHKLIKIKKGLDGMDYVSVMLDESTISTYMEQESSLHD